MKIINNMIKCLVITCLAATGHANHSGFDNIKKMSIDKKYLVSMYEYVTHSGSFEFDCKEVLSMAMKSGFYYEFQAGYRSAEPEYHNLIKSWREEIDQGESDLDLIHDIYSFCSSEDNNPSIVLDLSNYTPSQIEYAQKWDEAAYSAGFFYAIKVAHSKYLESQKYWWQWW